MNHGKCMLLCVHAWFLSTFRAESCRVVTVLLLGTERQEQDSFVTVIVIAPPLQLHFPFTLRRERLLQPFLLSPKQIHQGKVPWRNLTVHFTILRWDNKKRCWKGELLLLHYYCIMDNRRGPRSRQESRSRDDDSALSIQKFAASAAGEREYWILNTHNPSMHAILNLPTWRGVAEGEKTESSFN